MDLDAEESQIEQLLQRARQQDSSARHALLEAHRPRLRRLAEVRLDDRLSARVDPSDVVQETLMEASQRLDEFFQGEEVPVYIWLRQLAWEKIIDLHRRHLRAQKRSVLREDRCVLSSASADRLARLFMPDGTHPSHRLVHSELRHRVEASLAQLPERLREVLVMKYLEQLSTSEIAVAMGTSIRTIQARHREGLVKLQKLLSDQA